MNQDITKSLNPASEYLSELKTVLEERGIKPELSISSMPRLNNKLWGIKRRKLTLIAARPSVGKSSLALQFAYDLALQGKKILFLSLEMTTTDMLERLFCFECNIDNQDLMRGEFNKYGEEFENFKKTIKKLKFSLADCIGKNWQEVDSLLKELGSKPDAVFIDHLNAIKSNGNNMKAAIDEYILNIYAISKRENVAMILCCQINRDNQKDDDKTPQLHELKGSGNLEEMSDIVLLLHWPFKYKKEGQVIDRSKYQIIVAKNRNGPTGYVDINFKPENYRFLDIIENVPIIKQENRQRHVNWQD